MKKKWLTVLLVSVVAMFAWIIVAVALTGGRDVADFTSRDQQVMVGFGVAEAITFVVMLLSACMLGKAMGRTMPKPVPLTPTQKTRVRTGALLLWGALLLTFALQLGGIFLWKWNPGFVTGWAKWFCGLGYLLGLVVLPLLSLGADALYRRRFSRMNAREASSFVYSHREQAEETARRKLHSLEVLHRVSNGYALALFLLGLLLALLSGYLYRSDTFSVLRVFGAAFLVATAAQQLVMPLPRSVFQEMDGILSEEDYPQLYRLARQAAEENGWHGPVQLFVGLYSGMGMGKIRDVLCLHLGALTLGLMTREELYAIFLHEFAHREDRRAAREEEYHAFLEQGRNPNALSALSGVYYSCLDGRYELEYELYHYAAALEAETRADRAMAGNPRAAASALLKLKYFDLFLWEQDAEDGESDWQSETPPEHLAAREAARFQLVLPRRRADWQRLTKTELPARNATHPTTWARIQALGLQELPELSWPGADTLSGECSRVVEQMDAQITQGLAESYQEARRFKYLEPLERVQAWEDSGCPLVAEGYADVAEDLGLLHRQSDVIGLCQRAIETLPPAAACQAYFIRGIHRLHCYDEAGLEDLYTAIQGNSNFIEEALNQIGSFCCLTGNEKELEEYREKALELAQRQKDEFSQLDTLTRRDNLSQEHLPEGMLEGILDFLQAHDQGSVDKVFLVRKTITPEFFTSAVILRFLPDTPEETRETVCHQMFRYLDTSTDWQFSLFDEQQLPKGLTDRVENCCVFEKV